MEKEQLQLNDTTLEILRNDMTHHINPLTKNFDLTEEQRQTILQDDFLLLLSVIADQSVSYKISWGITFKLQAKLGVQKLTPQYLLDNADLLKKVMKDKPALHRYPDKMTEYFLSLCQILIADYNGEANQLLNSADFSELVRRLVKVKGISRKKAGLTCLILELDKGRKIQGIEHSYALVDTHVQHFLQKELGITRRITEAEATQIFKTIYPENPALVSTVVWRHDKGIKIG